MTMELETTKTQCSQRTPMVSLPPVIPNGHQLLAHLDHQQSSPLHLEVRQELLPIQLVMLMIVFE